MHNVFKEKFTEPKSVLFILGQILFLAMSTSWAQTTTIQDDNLLGRWEFDLPATGFSEDLSGNGNNAIINGNAIVDHHSPIGVSGLSLSLKDPIDYVSIPDLDYGESFSVSMWFKQKVSSGNRLMYLYQHGTWGEKNSLNIYMLESSGALRVLARDSDDGFGLIETRAGLNNDQWHHLYVSVSSQEGLSVYLDGQLDRKIDNGGNLIDPDGDINIGSNATPAENNFLGGEIDDVRIYKGATDSNEILNFYKFAISDNPTFIDTTPVLTSNVEGDGVDNLGDSGDGNQQVKSGSAPLPPGDRSGGCLIK